MRLMMLACVSLLGASLSHAEPLRSDWIALKVGGQIVTAGEIRRYIDSVVLSSDIPSELRGGLIDELFEPTLRRVAITRLLEEEAKRGPNRRYFALTRKQMREALEAQARTIPEPGRPRQALRLREQYRQQEVSRFLCRMGNCERQPHASIVRQNRSRLLSHHYFEIQLESGRELRGPEAFEFSLAQSPVEPQTDSPRQIWLGKLSPEKSSQLPGPLRERFELLHINDWNLLGSLGTALGYPKTDDMGRTSGFMLKYRREEAGGSLTVDLENWLFSERLPTLNGQNRQHVEEENTLRITSRQFLDEEGSRWVVVGLSGTHRAQQEGVGAWIQANFHKLNPTSTQRLNVARDGTETFVQGLLGVGGRYSIFEFSHVDLVLSGEAILVPALGESSQNSIQVRNALDLNIYATSRELPVFRLGAFTDFRARVDGSIETTIGVRATVGWIIRRIQLEAGLFVVRWDGELDRRYEQGASWTTGIMLAVTPTRPHVPVEYEF